MARVDLKFVSVSNIIMLLYINFVLLRLLHAQLKFCQSEG
uniref:Uncharacterized protein n=1 Tax=Anguilla anguilla TaxID=7936 RepID=A0A0E9P9S5_ANGAN